jgi:hypothetical protein
MTPHDALVALAVASAAVSSGLIGTALLALALGGRERPITEETPWRAA